MIIVYPLHTVAKTDMHDSRGKLRTGSYSSDCVRVDTRCKRSGHSSSDNRTVISDSNSSNSTDRRRLRVE